MEQKDEFSRYMETAKHLAACLATSTDKSRAFAWLKYLKRSANTRLRMDYLKLLVFSLQKNQLLGIFADDPPVEIQIPPFPGGVSLATMKNYLTALAAVDEGSGDTNLRAVRRLKSNIPLNIIPEEREILCYMLHNGNERESSPRRSCGCPRNNRSSAASEGRQSGQAEATPPRPNPLAFPWLREVPGQQPYDMGFQDPWLNFHYLQLRKKPKPKKKNLLNPEEEVKDDTLPSFDTTVSGEYVNLFTPEEQQNLSFPGFDVMVGGPPSVGVPEEMWQPADNLWADDFPPEVIQEQRISSPKGRSSGRPQSQSPQRFQQSPQQMLRMSPQTPGRSPQSPRMPPQMMQSPHMSVSPRFVSQGGFSPEYISTPVRRQPPPNWSFPIDNYAIPPPDFPTLHQPGRPKSRWAYFNSENAAALGAYKPPPTLSQTHPARRSPRRDMRDPASQTMYEFRNPVMRDADYYSEGPADLYEHAYNLYLRGDLSSTVESPSMYYDVDGNLLRSQQVPSPGPSPPPPRPMPLSTSFTTPRRPARFSPPRQLNVSAPAASSCGFPRRPGNAPPPSPEQRFMGPPPPQRSPSPGRSPSPTAPRGWEQQQLSYGDYTGTSADPRSYASNRTAAGSPSYQSGLEGGQRRRHPVYVHHCNCSCGNSPGPQTPQQQQPPPNQSPESFYMSCQEQTGARCDDSNSAVKQDPDDIGKSRLQQMDSGSPDSAHSGWEQAESSANSIPQEMSGADINLHQKSPCGCPPKGEHY